MKLTIDPNGIWYHGSSRVFSELRENSTITQWRELAEAFSHQPGWLSYDDDGTISHNGTKPGYLYVIDEPENNNGPECGIPDETAFAREAGKVSLICFPVRVLCCDAWE